MASTHSPQEIDLPLVLSLYEEFQEDLRSVRTDQRRLYEAYTGRRGSAPGEGRGSAIVAPSRLLSPSMRSWVTDHVPLSVLIEARRILKAVFPGQDLDPQGDDIDCEIAYLLVRQFRPGTVVEISPCGGWSTTWLLSALRDARHGHLYSYDLIDDSTRTVPTSLSQGRWTFTLGDVRKLQATLPARIDYLFLDAEHSRTFAEWYLSSLLPRVVPGGIVSVDDIFHPELVRRGETGEVEAVLAWLGERKRPYFTAAPSSRPEVYRSILEKKMARGLAEPIHSSTVNPGVFFRST